MMMVVMSMMLWLKRKKRKKNGNGMEGTRNSLRRNQVVYCGGQNWSVGWIEVLGSFSIRPRGVWRTCVWPDGRLEGQEGCMSMVMDLWM